MGTAISGLTPGQSSVSSTNAVGSNRLGKDEFLKLLTAQLQNQDPLAPTDNQQFIAQLAQFSTVEQAEAMNSRLDSLLMAQSSNNQTTTASFIGKDVVYHSDQVGLGPTGATILADVANSASKLTATLTDSKGKVVRTLSLNDVNAGPLTLPWDGKSTDGSPLAQGTYTVKFDATDAKGNAVTVTTQGRARVTGVAYSAGYPELIVNNVHVKMSDIVQVLEASASTTP